MMGYNHVSCGLCVGIATVPIAPVHGWAAQSAWILALGGSSLLPDLDTAGSTAARMWGPITGLLGAGIGSVAGGHRQGTHDAVLAPLGFAAVVLAATLNPLTTGLVIALTIGLALRGLALAGIGHLGAAANLVLSFLGAWWLVVNGAHNLYALPLLAAAGVLTHIVGDWMTTEGIPIPVAHLFGDRRRLSLKLFKVNTLAERLLVAPALSLLGIALLAHLLGIHDVDTLTRSCGSLLEQVRALTPPLVAKA